MRIAMIGVLAAGVMGGAFISGVMKAAQNRITERAFFDGLAETLPELPFQVDDRTTLYDVDYSASKGRVYLFFRLDTNGNWYLIDRNEFRPVKENALQIICPVLQAADYGFEVLHQYFDEWGNFMGNFEIQKADCIG